MRRRAPAVAICSAPEVIPSRRERRPQAGQTHLVLLVAMLALACAGGTADECPGAAIPDVPIDAPDLRGTITARTGETIRVEEAPGERSGSAKAIVGLTVLTWITTTRGERLPPEALLVGQRVAVWFTGPVAESYPLQGEGLRIIVE